MKEKIASAVLVTVAALFRLKIEFKEERYGQGGAYGALVAVVTLRDL